MGPQPLKIHFYPKQNSKKDNTCVLYMRILLQGKRSDISLSYSLKKESWDEKNQMLRQKHPDRNYLLNLTNSYRQKAIEAHQLVMQKGLEYDVYTIRQSIVGESNLDTTITLSKLFDRIIERKRILAGKNNAKATIQKYKRCQKHIKDFIAKKLSRIDVSFTQINLEFVEDFELYLKSDGRCCHNTAMKHIQTFKTIFKSALAHGYAEKNVFEKYKISMREVNREYLSDKEIAILIKYQTSSLRLSNVRDMFLFSCFTGLAYIDLKNLCFKNITFENNNYWIRTRRQKTNVKSNIPLLAIPLAILKKYRPDFENDIESKRLFKVISNQKMNEYLKDLARECQIEKVLTFHIARHTFATTVTLNNGVPIESISSMLGHKHISTTQHYAKLLDKKIGEDMNTLSSKLKGRNLDWE